MLVSSNRNLCSQSGVSEIALSRVMCRRKLPQHFLLGLKAALDNVTVTSAETAFRDSAFRPPFLFLPPPNTAQACVARHA